MSEIEISNDLLQVEIDEITKKKKQVYYDYYDVDGIKRLPVFIKKGGELFCKLSGGDIVDIKPHYNDKLYRVDNFVTKKSEAICTLNPESLNTKTFYKYDTIFNKYYKINNFQIQNNKVIANTQQITSETSNQSHSQTNSISSYKIEEIEIDTKDTLIANTQEITSETSNQSQSQTHSISSDEIEEIETDTEDTLIANTQEITSEASSQSQSQINSISLDEIEEIEIDTEDTNSVLQEKLTKELIKQMKKEVEQLKKQYKEQQKAKQKTINTNYYTQLSEEPIEVDNETEIEETKALKLLKQIYNTNYKHSERGYGTHISYNTGENINGNDCVFDITEDNGKTKKIYFNDKSKIKELNNLINACNGLITKKVFQIDYRGMIQ